MAARFRWDAIAQRHAELYGHLLDGFANRRHPDFAHLSAKSTAYESSIAS
jgi:hypothetical protein